MLGLEDETVWLNPAVDGGSGSDIRPYISMHHKLFAEGELRPEATIRNLKGSQEGETVHSRGSWIL